MTEVNWEKLNNYKREITFLIDRKGKIYYHNIDLLHDHEDLLLENKDTIKDYQVCRLVYDPNDDDSSFCGIPGIYASCNALYDSLPFELKSTHLNAIENWLKQYDSIVQYAEEHKNEYEPKDTLEDFVKSINRIQSAAKEKEKNDWSKCCELWEFWKEKYPTLIKYLDEQEEKEKIYNLNLLYNEDALQIQLENLLNKANKIQYRESINLCQSFIEEEVVDNSPNDSTKVLNIKRSVDLARFIEVTNDVIQKSGEPAALYFTLGGKFIYNVITKIAERACEIEDQPILELLEKLKMVERG